MQVRKLKKKPVKLSLRLSFEATSVLLTMTTNCLTYFSSSRVSLYILVALAAACLWSLLTFAWEFTDNKKKVKRGAYMVCFASDENTWKEGLDKSTTNPKTTEKKKKKKRISNSSLKQTHKAVGAQVFLATMPFVSQNYRNIIPTSFTVLGLLLTSRAAPHWMNANAASMYLTAFWGL